MDTKNNGSITLLRDDDVLYHQEDAQHFSKSSFLGGSDVPAKWTPRATEPRLPDANYLPFLKCLLGGGRGTA